MTADDDGAGGSAAGGERVGERVRIFRRGGTRYANSQARRRQHRWSFRTTSRQEARRRAARIDADRAAGTWGRAAPPATVAADVAAYPAVLRDDGRAAETLAKYAQVPGRVGRSAAARGAAALADLGLALPAAYRRRRAADGAAEKTRYTEPVIVRQLVRSALSRNLLAAGPQQGARLRQPRPAPQPCWTPAQVAAVLAAAPAEVRPALILLAETGLRVGELAWRTWADVDLAENARTVRPKDGWRPKTGEAAHIPALVHLERAAQRNPGGGA